MINQIKIKTTYLVDNRVFNVQKIGEVTNQKTSFDHLQERKYGYASAGNVKHCLFQYLFELMGYTPQPQYMIKTLDKGKLNQECCLTRVDIMSPEFVKGIWNPCEMEDIYGYYRIATKSWLNISAFSPLHTLLSSLDRNREGVKSGNPTRDKVGLRSNSKRVYANIQEYLRAEGIESMDKTLEENINNSVINNIFKLNDSCNGIYSLEIVIDMDRFGQIYNVDEISKIISDKFKPQLEQEIQRAVDLGCYVDGTGFLWWPKEKRKEVFEQLAKAILCWEFLSNNSTDGKQNKLLRVDIALNNSQKLDYATHGEVVAEKTARLVLIDNIPGVFSHTSPAIREILTREEYGGETDINIEEHAISNIIELGNKFFQ